MANKDSKDEYVPPKVWGAPNGGKAAFQGMNRPTAGARSEEALPVGTHALQLHSLATPNGQKVTVLLEEIIDAELAEGKKESQFEYDAYYVDIMKLDQFKSGFVSINPNSKIPALAHYVDGVDKKPLRVFESGNILIYLAELSGKFLPPRDKPRKRIEVLNWLHHLQGAAPYIGNFGHFYKYAPTKIKYGVDRFAMETKRILHVYELQLKDFYMGTEFLDMENHCPLVLKYVDTMMARPAVKRGVRVNSFTPDALRERHSVKDFAARDAELAKEAAEKAEEKSK